MMLIKARPKKKLIKTKINHRPGLNLKKPGFLQSCKIPGVKTLLLLLTTMANGGEWGVDTLGSKLFPTCLPLRLASQSPGGVLSYLVDKFWERFSNGAVTNPPL